jgi:hypothetical protein
MTTWTIALFLCFAFATSAQNLNISTGAVFDGEPFLAVDPNNHQHIVVAWMGFQLGQKIVIKTKASFDGGQSWSVTSNLPHLVPTNASADPNMYFDNDGNVYLAYIDYDNENFENGYVVVSKSSDGLTWEAPVIAINIEDCPDKLCIDRPWMVIDRSSGPLDGTIYITSMTPDNPNVNPPYHPFLVRSFDGGANFTLPRLLDTVGYLVGDEIKLPMPSPALSANGTFHAIYPSYELSQSVFAQYIHVFSQDGGNSLSHNVQETVMQATGFQVYPDTKSAHLLVSDPSDENHLALLFFRIENADFNVYLTESFDAGLNWTNKLKVNDNPAGDGIVHDLVWAHFNENGDLAICWRDRRNGGPGFAADAEIIGAIKYKDSSTVSANFLISDQLVEHANILANSGNDFMCIEYIGDTLHAVWGDVRTGTVNIFYNKLIVSEQLVNIQTLVEEDWRFQEVFPNPAQQFIFIDEQFIDARYKIYTELGKLFSEGIAESNKLDIVELSSGSYFLVITTTKGEYGYRFIKS